MAPTGTERWAGAVNAEGLAIYCADIGSIKNDNFGWAVVHGSRQRGGKKIDGLVDDIVGSLATGIKVALGFECPLWVPVPDDPSGLTDARVVDGNMSWSAFVGASALAAGLTETAWMLRETRRRLKDAGVPLPAAHVDWEDFTRADAGVFLWEAFVTGEAKAKGEDAEKDQHVADALTACKAFASGLPDPGNASPCEPPHDVRSLIGAAVLWSGWSEDLDLLGVRCVVVKPGGSAD